MTISLSTAVLPAKIARLIPLLGSDKDGEVIATVHAIGRSLKAAGRDWHDLAAQLGNEAPAPRLARHDDWRADLHLAATRINYLPERERDFITSLVSSTAWREPTAKQRQWLSDIAARLRSAA